MKWIEVNGIKVYGFHGCMHEESLTGTWFEADVAVAFDFSESGLKDDLNLTIDYVRIREIVEKCIKERAKLIETVLQKIVTQIKHEFENIEGLKIKLKKYNPPINGEVDHVAVVWEE